jgi:glycogen debranching enzyme
MARKPMPIEIASTAALVVDTIAEAQFYIPATGQSTRPRHTLKSGDTFAVLDSHGDVGATSGGHDGLFYDDTRFLSRLELRLNGMPPLLLGSNVSDDNSVLNTDLTNPDIYVDRQLVLAKDTLHIVRTTFLWKGTAYQRLGVHNHGEQPVDIRLSVNFGSDFADIFEVRGLERERRGTAKTAVLNADTVLLEYEGLDGRTRSTTVGFDPRPTRIDRNAGVYQLRLAPDQRASIFVAVGCDKPERSTTAGFYKAMFSARRGLKASARRATAIETSNNIFNEMVCRSIADLYMLMTDTPQGPYPYAGIPWYSTTFGRDGLITALEMLWLDPGVARGVLRRLAAYQAAVDDPPSDAQPGKILHEMRGGELAALHEVPFGLYYGSVDSTPLFVLLAGLYAERTGDDATLAELWPAIEAALGWIDGPGDLDRDGFTEYHRETEKGLANQGWKDSQDAIFHDDGKLAEGPIALAEVQGYVYAAKLLAARAARRLGKEQRAGVLEAQAYSLAERFESAFWSPDQGSYALALDGRKRPCRVQTSNAGQLLFTGMIRPDRAAAVVKRLLAPPSFSGWGIRTVSTSEARYNPMSYHNGSVWPHDNALIALGFARYGHKAAIEPVFQGLFDAASYMDLRRLPELFCGFQRRRGRGPTLYPVACSPQAWASGAPLLLLQASLGLEFDPAQSEIRLRDPRLPSFLDTVTLRNLRLGDCSVDLVARRYKDSVSIEVVRTEGTIRVSVVYGPSATS